MCLDAQTNRLIETVLLSTNNICFGWEPKKTNFELTPLRPMHALCTHYDISMTSLCRSYALISQHKDWHTMFA